MNIMRMKRSYGYCYSFSLDILELDFIGISVEKKCRDDSGREIEGSAFMIIYIININDR